MSNARSIAKRQRAALFPARPGATPASGGLDVTWGSPFDRACFAVSAPDLARRHPKPYGELMQDLTTATGCSEEEILAHGRKVRALLYFAEERLARESGTAISARQKHPYALKAVTPAF